MPTQKELDFIRENFNFLLGLFVVFQEIRKKEDIDSSLKKVLVNGLARSFIGGLASLTDPLKDKVENENLSIRIIPGSNLEKYKDIIKKIRDIRNKVIAHNDKKSILENENFYTQINLEIGESENLLYELAKILGEYIRQSMPVDKMKEEYIRSLNNIFK